MDDCFILWDESYEKLEVFHKILDEMNPNIKFTKDTSEEELPFLDVLVKKRNTGITTDIFLQSNGYTTIPPFWLLSSISH